MVACFRGVAYHAGCARLVAHERNPRKAAAFVDADIAVRVLPSAFLEDGIDHCIVCCARCHVEDAGGKVAGLSYGAGEKQQDRPCFAPGC